MAINNKENQKHVVDAMIASLKENGTLSIADILDAIVLPETTVNQNNGSVNVSDKTKAAAEKAIDVTVRNEINRLAEYIRSAKHEILEIVPEGEEKAFFDNAGEELNAVVEATEDATNKILDAADIIIAEANNIENAAAKEKITNSTTTIYNACNFQDITGQRITKVIKTLNFVEHKVAKLALMFGSDIEELKILAKKDIASTLKDNRPDAELMGGPQLPENATTQEEIDALFGS